MDVAGQLRASLSERYRIEREIGAGGMATVYLAHDLRHDRKVALKVLRPELGAVLGAERFLSEIKVTANLQHPHLLPLFDSGEADGLLFYVMPFVEGESLRDRLERERQLPVDEAVRIAVAVAGALDYAHRRGVVHRDLKPENILLHDGQPVIADFGIALAISNAGGARVTQTGLSLGTPQYMSPEQATGDRVIDGRTDIYSLAAVLYEMLVGDPPHMGSTTQAIIARVLTDRPQPVRVMRESVPEHVDAAVMHGLSKLPADRFATAAEFAEALTGARVLPQTSVTRGVAALSPPSRGTRIKPVLIGAALTLAGALVGAVLLTPRERAAQPAFFEVTFSDSSIPGTGGFALSRDGSQLAVDNFGPGGQRFIALRRMDALETRPIRGTESGQNPMFSPDGNWVAFFVDDKLQKVPVGGGAPALILRARGVSVSWTDRGEILFAPNGSDRQLLLDGPLVRVSENGGASSVVAAPDSSRGHLGYVTPHALPGGKFALIVIARRAGTELGVVRLRDGQVTELGISAIAPRYVASGHIVFGQPDGTVYAAPFSLRRRRLTGPAVRVLENVNVRSLRTSDNGLLVYQSITAVGYPLAEVVRVDRRGVAHTVGLDSATIMSPRIDLTGRRVALTIRSGGRTYDVWTYDLASSALTRLTSDSASQRPEWTRDGKRIIYQARSQLGGGSTHVQPWDGSGTAEVLIDSIVSEISWGPPGGFLALRRGSLTTPLPGKDGLWIAPVDSPRALRPFIVTTAIATSPRVSPNGRLLAYVSNETGSNEVYVRALPGPGGRVRVSTSGGGEPAWAANGRELFYRAPGHVMSATLIEGPELAVARKDTLFVDAYLRSGSLANYDVFPNGQEFLFVRSMGRSERGLFGIANWGEALKRRAPR